MKASLRHPGCARLSTPSRSARACPSRTRIPDAVAHRSPPARAGGTAGRWAFPAPGSPITEPLPKALAGQPNTNGSPTTSGSEREPGRLRPRLSRPAARRGRLHVTTLDTVPLTPHLRFSSLDRRLGPDCRGHRRREQRCVVVDVYAESTAEVSRAVAGRGRGLRGGAGRIDRGAAVHRYRARRPGDAGGGRSQDGLCGPTPCRP